MRNTIVNRYLALIGLLATVALLGATACSSSDNETSSSSSSESSAAAASEEDTEESPEEPQQETSEQIPDEEAEETSEEAGQARETLINIFIDFIPFENEDFVACLVDTTRENFGGTYARMLDGLFSDKETPKLDQASDDALEFCTSELTSDELQLVEELIEADENESEAEDSETNDPEETIQDDETDSVDDEEGASGPPPPTIGNCNTTIGVDYELFYDFSQAPDVVMVGYGEVLNLYDDPDVSSSVILTIPALEESIGYEGWSRQIASNTWPYAIWHCMTYNGFHGWVPDFYVSMLADSSAAWSGYGLVGLVRSDLEGFEVDVQNIFEGACPEYNGVGTQIILSDLQTRFNGGDVTFDIRGWCDDAASGIRLTLTAEKQLSRQESYEVISAEIRPLCMRGVSGQNCL